MHLISLYLTGVYLTGVYLTGVHLIPLGGKCDSFLPPSNLWAFIRDIRLIS
jgi:hypothetical protein